MSENEVKNIVTIGASAGGIPAVSTVISGLNPTLRAAVFVVIHIPRDAMAEVILREFQRNTQLECIIPDDGQLIENGKVYLGPANHHLMIEKDHILVRKGPYENHWRPAIDVLFRTAAAAYGSCVTGIILTGLMDDGTSGMTAIKKSGGTLIVQDPDEAEFNDMPKNVLQNVEVDYKVRLHEIPYIITDIYSKLCSATTVPEEVALEAELTIRMGSNLDELRQISIPSDFTCPDCGGILSKIVREQVTRYRCFTGHTFTAKILAEEQNKGIEESLWTAIRMMEERKNLLNTMGDYNSPSKQERAEQLTIHIERLKSMLLEVRLDPNNN